MKKVASIILIITIAIIYLIREGKRTALNPDGTINRNLSMSDYFFLGLSANMGKMTPKQTDALVNISKFCFRSI